MKLTGKKLTSPKFTLTNQENLFFLCGDSLSKKPKTAQSWEISTLDHRKIYKTSITIAIEEIYRSGN